MTLTVGEFSETQTLEVRADPRTAIAQAEFDEQFDFLRQVGETIEQMAERFGTLRSAREQVNGLKGRAGDAGLDSASVIQVEEAADSLVAELTGVGEDIQQNKSTSFYGPLEYPGRLTAQLAYVYGVAAGSFGGTVDSRPTDGSRERFDELRAEVDAVLGRLQVIFDSDLAAFNELNMTPFFSGSVPGIQLNTFSNLSG